MPSVQASRNAKVKVVHETGCAMTTATSTGTSSRRAMVTMLAGVSSADGPKRPGDGAVGAVAVVVTSVNLGRPPGRVRQRKQR